TTEETYFMESNGYWTQLSRGRLSRRSVLRSSMVGGAGLAAAALIGCGDGDDGEPSATAAPSGTTGAGGTATATSTAATGTPIRGGTVSARLPVDPPNWSVLKASGPVAQAISFCYDALTALAT